MTTYEVAQIYASELKKLDQGDQSKIPMEDLSLYNMIRTEMPVWIGNPVCDDYVELIRRAVLCCQMDIDCRCHNRKARYNDERVWTAWNISAQGDSGMNWDLSFVHIRAQTLLKKNTESSHDSI